MIGLFLLGCATPVWTVDGALADHRVVLDADADGRVDAAEYGRTRWEGPSFAGADGDGDGDLSTTELVALFQAQSPTNFDGDPAPQDLRPSQPPWSLPRAQQDVWEVLAWMAEALKAAGRPGPDPVLVDQAVLSGELSSPAGRQALASLQGGWLALGWPWPEGLPLAAEALPPGAPGADSSSAVVARIQAQLRPSRQAPAQGAGGAPAVSPAGGGASPGAQ